MKDLDSTNKDFINATEFVLNTNKSVYLTGKAGTGKTTFLKYIQENSPKNMVVLAPTGVAAINASGTTINSFFQIPFGPFLPDDQRLRTSARGTDEKESIYTTFKYSQDKKELIKNLEVLIIDEVSMVRSDTLDIIDKILKVFRSIPYLPFGGVQVLLIGDTHQLPPVAKRNEWAILSEFYSTEFFFGSQAWSQLDPVHIELKKIYRQKEQQFIDILNRIRNKEVTQADLALLNSKYDPSFNGYGEDYITLSTHRDSVNQINENNLNMLEEEQFNFAAKVEGNFPEGAKPTEQTLSLKEGAQIMFVKNDSSGFKQYYNGKIGKISSIEEETIKVQVDGDHEIEVEKARWENYKYTYNKEEKSIEKVLQGSFEQFPIKLAWAITVHKSQGLTFEKVIVDLANSFSSGQVYVALSRCTSLEHLVLRSKITKDSIKVASKVLEFGEKLTSENEIIKKMSDAKADQLYKKAREYFENGEIEAAFKSLKEALKFRNDIEVPDFKRYILVHLNKLFGYKKRFYICKSDAKSNKQFKVNKTIINNNNFEDDDKSISKDKINSNLKRAHYYYSGGYYSQAYTFYNLVIMFDPYNYEALVKRASSGLKAFGNTEKQAILDFRKANSINPNNKDYHFFEGFCKSKCEDYRGAILEYTCDLEISPNRVLSYEYRANCKKEIKYFRGAILDYTKVIELDPENQNALNNRAFCREQIMDFVQAIKDYDKLIKLRPNTLSATYYFKRGLVKSKLNNFEDARTDFDNVIKIDQTYTDAFFE
jgi:tetratricopeptide (TPR) repeat protein